MESDTVEGAGDEWGDRNREDGEGGEGREGEEEQKEKEERSVRVRYSPLPVGRFHFRFR